MNESASFTLPVTFQGKDYELKARFERWGYSHRFAVLIGEDTIIFEPDEEGNYRALGNLPHPTDSFQAGLIRATAETLRKLRELS